MALSPYGRLWLPSTTQQPAKHPEQSKVALLLTNAVKLPQAFTLATFFRFLRKQTFARSLTFKFKCCFMWCLNTKM